MKCIERHGYCRSPTACSGFGYCRVRNLDGTPMTDAKRARNLAAQKVDDEAEGERGK